MPDDEARRPDGGEDPVYIHKPSLMGAPWELLCVPTHWNGAPAGTRAAFLTRASGACGCRSGR